jgi:hypothetical protein
VEVVVVDWKKAMERPLGKRGDDIFITEEILDKYKMPFFVLLF